MPTQSRHIEVEQNHKRTNNRLSVVLTTQNFKRFFTIACMPNRVCYLHLFERTDNSFRINIVVFNKQHCHGIVNHVYAALAFIRFQSRDYDIKDKEPHV